MQYNTLTQVAYENTRYQMLLQLEESGTEKLSPYVDPVGLPTIGAGFNLTDRFVRNQVFSTLDIGETGLSYAGLGAEGQVAEDSYVQRITDVIDATYFDASDTSIMQDQLNIIMYERSADPLIPYAINPTFTFNDAGEVRATFDGIMRDRYEGIVTQWFSIELSNERLALVSLAYNSRTSAATGFPTTLGGNLSSALRSDDRAEAWFEIRYNTNAERSGGVARRRYIESEMFGLYDEGVNAFTINDDQAKEVYRMFARHRADTIYGNNGMIAYDNNFSGNLSNASTEASLIGLEGIGTLQQELEPAYTFLINTYTADTNITIDWRDVQVAEESGGTLNGTKRTGNTFGTNEDQSDLLIGSDANDTLNGAGGNDILIGGMSRDQLTGGAGDDYLNGGAGYDFYYYQNGDGNDVIKDTDKLGNIRYDRDQSGMYSTLRGGKSQTPGGGTYYSPDKSIAYKWNGIAGSRLTISMQGNAGGITVEDFNNGDLGISLRKRIPDPWPDHFNDAQIAPFRCDPLALDLDGDGLETVGVSGSDSVMFDLNNEGIQLATGWIAPDDGFLVYDRNGNGLIDNGSELFGNATPINNDTAIAGDGFEALVDFDSNGNGVVDASDIRFADLRIWQDLNTDGITQTGELKTFDELGIESISTAYENTQFEQNGNIISALGSYTRVDGGLSSVGSALLTGDLNLSIETFYSNFTESIPLTGEAQNLPFLSGSGKVRDMREAASLSPEFATALAMYSAAITRDEQPGLLDDLLLKWSKSNDMSTISDEGYRLHSFDACLHYHVQRAA